MIDSYEKRGAGLSVCLLAPPISASLAVAEYCTQLLEAELLVLEKKYDSQKVLDILTSEGMSRRNVLVVSTHPDSELVDLISRAADAVIVFAPDSYICAMQRAVTSDEDIAQWCRELSESLSLIASASTLVPRVVFTGSNVIRELKALSTFLSNEFARSHEGALSVARDAVIRSLYAEAQSADNAQAESPPLPTHSRRRSHTALVKICCEGLLQLVRGNIPTRVCWPSGLFFDTKNFARPCLAELDLAGPARCLFYGPYLHLPIGMWTVNVELQIVGKSGPTHFRLEILSDSRGTTEQFSTAMAETDGSGRFSLAFPLALKDPGAPLQLRVILERGEIEGRVGLLGVLLNWADGATL